MAESRVAADAVEFLCHDVFYILLDLIVVELDSRLHLRFVRCVVPEVGNQRDRLVGGVVGAQWGGSITGCSSSATVKGTVDVGGVAGQTNSNATMTACYATGNVTSTGSSTVNVYIGGFCGYNSTTVTACYWKNNKEQGIGYNKVGTDTEVTKVDGTDVTWQKAVDAMNTALQNAGSEWRYELNGALPTLRKQ